MSVAKRIRPLRLILQSRVAFRQLAILAIITPYLSLSESVGAESRETHVRITRSVHALAGDDLKAYLGFVPSIDVIEHPLANAMARKPNRITITTGLLNLLRADDELGFVIAHELGHLRAGGEASLGGEISDQELRADRYAVELLKAAGIPSTAAGSALRRVLNNQLSFIGPSHPTCQLLSERIRRLNRSISKE